MGTVALSGADTIIINNRPLVDLADGDCVILTYPNDIANVQTGKNGNSIYALNESGKICEVKIKLLRASADDKFLLGLLASQQNNFAGTILLIGQFIKKVGDGQSNIASDTYTMSGGIFTKQLEGKTNVQGEIDQSTVTYMIKFSNAPRVIT